MSEQCKFCNAEDQERIAQMTWIADLKVSVLYFYREQTYPGRCVLALKNHVRDLTLLDSKTYDAFMQDVRKAALALTKIYHPDKINYLILGDLSPHLHMHLVPKYKGGADWGTVFQMMPDPPRYLTQKDENSQIQKIRNVL